MGGERDNIDRDASGVGGLEGGGEGGSSSALGREVVEVDWATLLDGSRVLELLYRLEVLIYLSVFSVLRGWFWLRFLSGSRGVMAKLLQLIRCVHACMCMCRRVERSGEENDDLMF